MVVSIIYINTTQSLRITSKEFKNDLFVISDPRGNWQLLASQQGCLDLTLPQTKKKKKKNFLAIEQLAREYCQPKIIKFFWAQSHDIEI